MQDVKIPDITDKAEINRLLHNLGVYVKSGQFEQDHRVVLGNEPREINQHIQNKEKTQQNNIKEGK